MLSFDFVLGGACVDIIVNQSLLVVKIIVSILVVDRVISIVTKVITRICFVAASEMP